MELVIANELPITPSWRVNLERKKNALIYLLGICSALREILDLS